MECQHQSETREEAGSGRRLLATSRTEGEAAAKAIARAAALVEEQRQRVERIWAAGHDATQAQRLLNLMLDALEVMLQRRRISRAIRETIAKRAPKRRAR